MKSNKKNNSSYGKPIAISLFAHLMLVVALLWGTDFTMNKAEPTGMVQAVVIDPARVRQQAQEIRKQRETAAKKEQDRLDKLRRESEQLERNRKAEEERIRKLKQQQAKDAQAAREAEKRREVERQRAAKAEAERKAKEEAVRVAEQQRVAKEAAIAKAEKERLEKERAIKEAQQKAQREKEAAERAEKERIAKEKAAKEAAEKARIEKERLQQLERERKEQEAALDNIFSGLESEAALNTSARSKHVASEVQRMGAIYTQLIQQKLLLEDSFRGKQCRVNLKLIPAGNGAIAGQVAVLDGDSRLCAATKRAIAQVGTFPLSKEADVNQQLKNINLTVVPE
ncbi:MULTISPECIES: cell envelope integrity protein TolA [Vibrio]|uniref:cell envelope integrity protein TolA n=1 Tax=Vibrio TaxID=662 RepID=UPI0001542323|nr:MULTISPECIES: cell envelope integrity protein TolA [Vibrio]EDL51085.1 tolA protein [Vibrio mediterranei AK1]MCF4174557.1 cell envelope integrity protein TolA [Vibrio sp. McD22-P3]MCY9854064.1 cell envelope integrity protein TolA [Vibrio mediterranei]MDA0108203.1 cell envelope integrity protein TolA [Vibrio sp. La 4.2.2]NOI24822.1 cell envelope integrity protein TolA [Vibrio mediterranei]